MGAVLVYLLTRLASAVPTVFLVSLTTFTIIHLIPGDAAQAIAGDQAPQETVDAIRRELGLDRPLYEQFGTYILRLAHGDLGQSIASRAEVRSDLAARFPATLQLAVGSTLLAIGIGMPLGIVAALRRGTRIDLVAMFLSALLVSAPSFVVAIVLILVFAVGLGWLPAAGRDNVQSSILPTIALAAYPLALVARITRSELLEVLGSDYLRTARAKGLRESVVVRRHALRNALLPVVTIVGLTFGVAMGGAVVVETVFGWPGVGRLIVEAIGRRDFPIVQGGLTVLALVFISINLMIDLACAWLDPRIRYQ
jgi:ABC-type dipeptide/oligopeptide/nickel transport system permease component